MAEIYIAFVDTPGFFAGIIRRVIKQKYIHVALSLDPYLEETYSIGRRHPSVPLIAGFEKEDKYILLTEKMKKHAPAKFLPGHTFLLVLQRFFGYLCVRTGICGRGL